MHIHMAQAFEHGMTAAAAAVVAAGGSTHWWQAHQTTPLLCSGWLAGWRGGGGGSVKARCGLLTASHCCGLWFSLVERRARLYAGCVLRLC